MSGCPVGRLQVTTIDSTPHTHKGETVVNAGIPEIIFTNEKRLKHVTLSIVNIISSKNTSTELSFNCGIFTVSVFSQVKHA